MEAPILDGSSGPWAELIERAGVVQLQAPRAYLRAQTGRGQGKGSRNVDRARQRIPRHLHDRLQPPDDRSSGARSAFAHRIIQKRSPPPARSASSMRDRDAAAERAGARRIARKRDRADARRHAQPGASAVRGRVRAPQDSGHHRRPGAGRDARAGACARVALRAWAAHDAAFDPATRQRPGDQLAVMCRWRNGTVLHNFQMYEYC